MRPVPFYARSAGCRRDRGLYDPSVAAQVPGLLVGGCVGSPAGLCHAARAVVQIHSVLRWQQSHTSALSRMDPVPSGQRARVNDQG